MLWRFTPLVRRYRWGLIAAGLLMALEIPVSALPPLIARDFFDRVLPGRDLDLAFTLFLTILAVVGVGELIGLVHGTLLARVRVGFSFRLRLHLLRHLQSLSMSFFTSKDTGYLMARQNEDAANLEEVFSVTFLRIVIDAIRTVVFVGLLLYLEALLAAVVFAIVLAIAGYNGLLSRALRERSKKLRESSARANSLLHDALGGQALVRAAVGEREIRSVYSRRFRERLRQDFRYQLLSLLSTRGTRLGTGCGVGIVLMIGIGRIISGEFTVGGMFAFILYIGRLFDAVNNLAAANPAVQRALASAGRITELLDIEPQVQDRPGAVARRIERGRVELRAVSFGYRPGVSVLQEIELTAEPGETVALVGPSGAGKSTLVSLIPRFYDFDAGELLIDGVDVRDYRLRFLRRQIALVPQEIFLLNGSVRENLVFGLSGSRRISDEMLQAATEAANAHEFIAALPEGYDTLTGERGVTLSGGERQRLAIARELLRDPKILILDEATSQLDTESERLVQDALCRLRRNRTTFVIAHRLSTIQAADQILVLDSGRIVAGGRHRALLESSDLYRSLYEKQFRTEAE